MNTSKRGFGIGALLAIVLGLVSSSAYAQEDLGQLELPTAQSAPRGLIGVWRAEEREGDRFTVIGLMFGKDGRFGMKVFRNEKKVLETGGTYKADATGIRVDRTDGKVMQLRYVLDGDALKIDSRYNFRRYRGKDAQRTNNRLPQRAGITGVWYSSISADEKLVVVFGADGKFTMMKLRGKKAIGAKSGRYEAREGRVSVQFMDGKTSSWSYRIQGDVMEINGERFQRVRKKAGIEGNWSSGNAQNGVQARFANGRCVIRSLQNGSVSSWQGRYTVRNGRVDIVTDTGRRVSFAYRVEGNTLTLQVGDSPIRLQRAGTTAPQPPSRPNLVGYSLTPTAETRA